MKRRVILILAVCLSGCASTTRQQMPSLPGSLSQPGKLVVHPNKTNVCYYFVTRWQKTRTVVEAQDRALYVSRDSGGSWDVLCDDLGFVSLFIHPGTGVLYAVVGENDALRVDQEGSVKRGVVQKIVMSADGVSWKDITPNRGNLGGVSAYIVRDPDNPGRIRPNLDGGGFRPSTVVIRWLDDAYLQYDRTEEDLEQLLGQGKTMDRTEPDGYLKAKAILAEAFPARVDRLDPDKKATGAMEAIEGALTEEFGAEKAADIAFHMADWNSDAAFILALHLFPERFTKEEIEDGVRDFLLHAPNHVAEAAQMIGFPVSDISKEAK